MADLKSILGFKIKNQSTDSVASQAATGSWSSGGSLNTARTSSTAMGTLTDALVTGGNTAGPGASHTATTENYNGTSWTEVNDLNTSRRELASAGTDTAAIAFGGEPQTDATEEYDGSSWTAGGALNTSRYTLGGFGTQTAAVAAGGYRNSPAGTVNAAEEYNGSSWTTVTNYPASTNALSGVGPQTAGLIGSGDWYEYDGTNWTAGGTASNTAGYKSVAGVQTNATSVGGNPPSNAPITEKYNGTSWSTSSATLNTGRYVMATWGTAAGFGVAGGSEPSKSNKTEEFVAVDTAKLETIDVT